MPTTHLELIAHHGLERLAAREHAWQARLNGVRLPDWAVALLRAASRLGDGVFWYALMGSLLVAHGLDALQPVHGDLATVLATLRYRMQPRLDAAAIEIEPGELGE